MARESEGVRAAVTLCDEGVGRSRYPYRCMTGRRASSGKARSRVAIKAAVRGSGRSGCRDNRAGVTRDSGDAVYLYDDSASTDESSRFGRARAGRYRRGSQCREDGSSAYMFRRPTGWRFGQEDCGADSRSDARPAYWTHEGGQAGR